MMRAIILALSLLSLPTAYGAALFCGDMAGKVDELRKLIDKGYKGPKPELEAGGFKKMLRKATSVPDDAEVIYGRAIPEAGGKGKVWWSYNENCGCWYRFEGKDTVQFSGMTTPKNPEFKPPEGAKFIKDREVPTDVARRQELQGDINRLGRPPAPTLELSAGSARSPDAYSVVNRQIGAMKPDELKAIDVGELKERIYGVDPKSTKEESDAYIKAQGYKPTDEPHEYEITGPNGEKTTVERPDNYRDAWWSQKHFHQAQPGARNYYKVYIGMPPEQVTSELGAIAEVADKKGAVGLKFGASANDVKRTDRFIVYFDDPDKAVAFANDMNKRMAKYPGESVPDLTYRYGDRVGIGTDDMVAMSSQRARASKAAAEAAKGCAEKPKQCLDITCKAFEAAGISAKTFASASLAKSLGIPYEACVDK